MLLVLCFTGIIPAFEKYKHENKRCKVINFYRLFFLYAHDDIGLKGNQGRRNHGSAGSGSFRIMSLFERKSPPKDERKSMFYVDVEDTSSSAGGNREISDKFSFPSARDSLIPTVSVTAGSQEEGLNICGPPLADKWRLQEAASKGNEKLSIPQITCKRKRFGNFILS